MAEVCVDAGLVVKLVTQEIGSEQADAQFAEWRTRKVRLIAPSFAEAEIDSVLRKKVHRGELTPEMAETSFVAACQLPLKFPSPRKHRQRTWEIAKEFRFPAVYDATYLALAELRGCAFWTADSKLYERVKDRLGFVKLLPTEES